MRLLRKLIGSKMQFKYVTEYVELLPNKQINCYEKDISTSETNARRSGNHGFEYYDDRHSKWFVISDIEYYNILSKHKNPKTLRRTKTKEVIKNKTLYEVFDLTTHFVQRLYERYVNHENAIPPLLTYMIENGIVLDSEHPIIQYRILSREEQDNTLYLYEKDFRMLWVCTINKSNRKLKLITAYDPDGQKWIETYLQKTDGYIPVKNFIMRII